MVYCDKNTKILEWGSEEIALPYRSPHDNRIHRYFPDFYIKVQENTAKIKRYLIEVKPLKQTTKPKKPKRQTKGYIREAFEHNKPTFSAMKRSFIPFLLRNGLNPLAGSANLTK